MGSAEHEPGQLSSWSARAEVDSFARLVEQLRFILTLAAVREQSSGDPLTVSAASWTRLWTSPWATTTG
jgi:hypothetical protein